MIRRAGVLQPVGADVQAQPHLLPPGDPDLAIHVVQEMRQVRRVHDAQDTITPMSLIAATAMCRASSS